MDYIRLRTGVNEPILNPKTHKPFLFPVWRRIQKKKDVITAFLYVSRAVADGGRVRILNIIHQCDCSKFRQKKTTDAM